jgi:hypothetical protein
MSKLAQALTYLIRNQETPESNLGRRIAILQFHSVSSSLFTVLLFDII